MRCAYHPGTETELTCGRCDKPICPRCLVHTEVGIRCPDCCEPQQRHHLVLFTTLAFGVVALLVSVVAIPPLLGLKPHTRSTALPTIAPLPPVAVMPSSPRPSPTPSYDLLIVSSSCQLGQHSIKCTGSVKNVSGHALHDVQVVIEQTDAGGTPQSSDFGPIDYNPLLPDQESPWTVYPSFNPALNRYYVLFRTAQGQPLYSITPTP